MILLLPSTSPVLISELYIEILVSFMNPALELWLMEGLMRLALLLFGLLRLPILLLWFSMIEFWSMLNDG